MAKRWLTICAMLFLASVLVAGCGIPQEEHDAVVAERDAAKAQVASLQTDLDTVQSELTTTETDLADVESNLTAVQSELTSVQSQFSSLQSDLNETMGNLAKVKEQLDKMEDVFGVLLFFDDFEDGEIEVGEGIEVVRTQEEVAWLINEPQSWSVIQENGNYFLKGVERKGTNLHADIAGSFDWTDYTLEFKFNASEIFWVNFRATTDLSERYMLAISEYSVWIHKGPSIIVDSNWKSQLRGWNDLKIEVYGANIKVYVNGVLEIDYTDTEPLRRGGIGFEFMEYSRIYLDNVLITRAK